MTTLEIRQRVRQNLNRDDVGIDARIQGWINDAKRAIEEMKNFDYMLASVDLTVSDASPSAPLPERFKAPVEVRYALGDAWIPLPRLSEDEVLNLRGPSVPQGYTLGESNLTVHPTPDGVYIVRLAYWCYSPDWAFTTGEEPYLARHAWRAIIALATSFGLSSFGEHQDAQQWERRAALDASMFFASEMYRSMHNEDLTLRVSTGASGRRPSRRTVWGV